MTLPIAGSYIAESTSSCSGTLFFGTSIRVRVVIVCPPNAKVLIGAEFGRKRAISSSVPKNRAWLGHTDAHIARLPIEVRSYHSSHFIISSMRVFIFGIPKGQARTQLLQAMQRGFLADCTTPSAVRFIAWAGQTSAQVGESQCMQTTGTVCVEFARSM